MTCGQRPAPRESPTSDVVSINSDTDNNFATLVDSTQYKNLEQSLITAEKAEKVEMEQPNPDIIKLIVDLGQLQGASRTRAELAIRGAEHLYKRLLKETKNQPRNNKKQPTPGANLQPPDDFSQPPLISRFPTPPPVKRTRNDTTATGPRRTRTPPVSPIARILLNYTPPRINLPPRESTGTAIAVNTTKAPLPRRLTCSSLAPRPVNLMSLRFPPAIIASASASSPPSQTSNPRTKADNRTRDGNNMATPGHRQRVSNLADPDTRLRGNYVATPGPRQRVINQADTEIRPRLNYTRLRTDYPYRTSQTRISTRSTPNLHR